MKKKVTLILSIMILVSIFLIKSYSVTDNSQKNIEQNFQNENILEETLKNDIEQDEIEDEENYTEEYKEYLKLSDEEKEAIGVIPRKYKVPLDMIYEDTEEVKEDASLFNLFGVFAKTKLKSTYADELPSSYNLKDHINIKVENQEKFGLCWAFASIKSLETNLSLKEGVDYDFSEMHLGYIASLYESPITLNSGGNFYNFKKYLLNNKGPVLEEDVPYKRIESEAEYDYLDSLEPVIQVKEIIEFPSINKGYEDYTEEELNLFREKVKRHIMQNGSVYCYILGPSVASSEPIDYISNNFSQYHNMNNGKSQTSYHAVSIIGWDDNYSRENFIEGNRPEHDGAYIALNSWGENWGYDGVFYISYDDIDVEQSMCGVVEATSKPSYKEIKFNDFNLYNKLKKDFGKEVIAFDDANNTLTLTQLSIDSLDRISISVKDNVQDLKGIENFKNITYVSIYGNGNMKNVDMLKHLTKVESLLLSDCGIQDIGFLSELKELTILNLNDNEIIDITSLKSLNKLTDLSLNNNNITDITSLESLTNLLRLYLSDNNITNIVSLKDLKKIEFLDLGENNITDIAVLKNLTNLSDLNLSNNNITDITALKELPLIQLNISNNNITDINALKNMNWLSYLILANNKDINDFKVLEELENLGAIDISGINKSINFEKLHLIRIEMNDVNISQETFEEMLQMPNLNYIELKNCNLTDVSALNNLIRNSEYLYLDLSNNPNLDLTTIPRNISGSGNVILENCNIKNLDELSGLKVAFLNLSHNDITNIDALNNIEIEYMLNLSYNKITQVSLDKVSSKLQEIEFVNLEGNEISDDFGNDIIELGNLQANTNNYISFESIFSQNSDYQFLLNTLKGYEYSYDNPDIDTEECYMDYKLQCIVINPSKVGEGIAKISTDVGNPIVLKYNATNHNNISNIIAKNMSRSDYFEGENFDVTGIEIKKYDESDYTIKAPMELEVVYDNGYSYTTKEFTIDNGNDLKVGQKSVIARLKSNPNVSLEIPIKVYSKLEYEIIECDNLNDYNYLLRNNKEKIGEDNIYLQDEKKFTFAMKKSDILSIKELRVNTFNLKTLSKFKNLETLYVEKADNLENLNEFENFDKLEKIVLKAENILRSVALNDISKLTILDNVTSIDLSDKNIINNEINNNTINKLFEKSTLENLKLKSYCIEETEDIVKLPEYIIGQEVEAKITYLGEYGQEVATEDITIDSDTVTLNKSIEDYAAGMRKISIKVTNGKLNGTEFDIYYPSENYNIENEISLTTVAIDTLYGKELDLVGKKLYVHYNFAILETIPLTSDMIVSEFNNQKLGIQNLDIVYKGKETILIVNVKQIDEFEEIDSFEYNGSSYIYISSNFSLENVKEKISGITKIEENTGTVIEDMNKCVATGNKITRRDGSKYIVIVKGDVNGDGIIDIQDMITINNYRLYNTENNLEEVYKLAADVNDDKEIDIQDMIVINNYRLYLTSF